MKKLMLAVRTALTGAAVWAAYGPYEDELPNGLSEAMSFCADTGYVTLTKSDTANSSRKCYAFCYNGKDDDPDSSGKGALGEWSVSGAPQKESKYYVGKIGSSRGVLCTDNSKGGEFHFKGSELVIGSYGRLQPMTATSATNWIDNLYMLGGAQFYWTGDKSSLQGTAHIRRSSAASPVEFYTSSELTIPCGLAFEGNADQCIAFKGGAADGEVVFTQDGDWSRFYGAILVTNVKATGITRVRFDTIELPARVTVDPNCKFGTNGNSINLAGLTERTETPVDIDAGATWTVGDFVVDANVTMEFADATATFVVTNSFEIKSGSLTIKLLTGGFDMTLGDVSPIRLISFGPKVDLSSITVDTFRYEGLVKAGMPTVSLALERDETTGVTTLVARRKTVVERTSAVETADSLSSHFWRAEKNAKDEFCWTDSQAPHSGADYLLTQGAIPPKTGSKTEGFTFGGDSLTIKGVSQGVEFVDKNSVLSYFDFKDLRIVGDNGEYVMFRTYDDAQPTKSVGGENLNTWELRGRTTIVEGASLHHSPYGGRLQYMTGEQVGAGSIELSTYSTSTKGASAKETNSGRIMFGALNTNYTGRIYFNQPYFEKIENGKVKYAIPDKDVHVWLYMTDGRNLGGPLPAFSYNALSVNDWGRLVALNELSNDLVLDQANRGIWVGWVGQFDVHDAATTLTIKNPLTLAGNLYKRGAGTLVLASQLRFAENNDVNDIGTPRANSNLVTVTEGALKVTHAHALDGAAVSFAADTKLVIPVDADATSDLAKFGAINTKENGGFSSMATDGKIPVEFDYGDMPIAMLPISGKKVAICTAKAESGEALCGKFSILPRIGVNAELSSEVAEGIDGAYTVYATLTFNGLAVTENCSMDGSKLTLELDITDVGGADKLTVELKKKGDTEPTTKEVTSPAAGKHEVVFRDLMQGDYAYQIKLTFADGSTHERGPVEVTLAAPAPVTPQDGKFMLSANGTVDLTDVDADNYAVSSVAGKKCHLKWTDANGKYAVMSEGKLTVKEGQPANGMDSYESYVLGLNADNKDSKLIVRSVQGDDPSKLTLSLGVTVNQDAGMPVSFKLLTSTTADFSGTATESDPQENDTFAIDLSKAAKVSYYKIEAKVGE